MSLPMVAEPHPLQTDERGVVKVAGTRITLDTIVYAFQEGASAEEIAYRYPSLDLADIYSTITYYLRNREAVDAYLGGRESHATEVRRQNESRFDSAGLRERLLARRGP